MVAGFEEQTVKLSKMEREMADIMAPAFATRKGRANAISSTDIIDSMTGKGYKISGSRLRKIVNYLVVTDRVKDLIASGNGYYVAATDQERKEHALSLGQRMASIMLRLKKSPYAGEVIYGIKQLKCLE